MNSRGYTKSNLSNAADIFVFHLSSSPVQRSSSPVKLCPRLDAIFGALEAFVIYTLIFSPVLPFAVSLVALVLIYKDKFLSIEHSVPICPSASSSTYSKSFADHWEGEAANAGSSRRDDYSLCAVQFIRSITEISQ